MRRYVVEVSSKLEILDEAGVVVGFLEISRKVAIDIRGRERDRIVQEVVTEQAEDIIAEAKTVLQIAGQMTQ